MSDLDLTQADLNVQLRGMTETDILMFLPDKNIYFPSNAVSVNNTPLSYTSNVRSLIEFSRLPQANIATFENNSWILDGSFISPAESYGSGGDSYTGYIANNLTDDNGNYTTNPIISISLSLTAPKVEYISMKFAGGIDTSYPKTVKIRTYNESNTLIREHTYDLTTATGLPLLVSKIDDSNVRKVEFELVGTQCPHRRVRLNKILFGKAEQIDPYYLQSWKVDDKASLVADSIPTKTFEFNIINYEGDYNIDNPGNKIPEKYKDTLVFFTLGIEKNGLYKYAPQKTFNLTNVSTTSDGLVTFSCGSLLDVLTDAYDQDTYTGTRTVRQIMEKLLAFSEVSTDQCIFEGDFANYKVNIPLPESPVREIIQKLAFSCGAALLVNDDNQIVFSKKNISKTATTPKFMFHEPQPNFESAGLLLEEPNAEALEHTTNIAMYTYDTNIIGSDASDTQIVGEQNYEVGSIDVYTMSPTRIDYSPVAGSIFFDAQSLQNQHATLVNGTVYSQHTTVTVTWDETQATAPIQVKVYGRKAETTKTLSKYANADTLLLDSGMALTTPSNLKRPAQNADPNTFYYTDWYDAKFKYICKTRNEYLIKAGDIILFETPFSDGEAVRVGYVLRNSYSDAGDSGEMEVIKVGNN